ncbi:MAG: glycosyl hydrolase, partial [Bacteroidota bacterium]
MHPVNSSILFAATNIGVFKTTDAGANWTSVSTISAHDVEFHPTNPDIVYACSDEFFRSTDGGNSFTLIVSGLPAATAINRFRIAVSADEPEWVYVLGGNQSNHGFEGVFRSTDAGLNFSLRGNSPNIFGWQNAGNDTGGQSWYDLGFAINPANADELWVGGVNIWKSANGGTSYTLQTQWTLPNNTFGYVHADIHDLAMFGSRLYCGSDGGIFKSENLGEDWTNLSAGLSITQFYDIGGSRTDPNIFIGGAQDNGTMVYSGTPIWGQRIGGDGITCIINPVNPNIQYGCTQTGSVYKSTNGGASFSVIVSTGFFAGESSAWATMFVLDPNDPNTIYVGYKSIYKSTAAGITWTSLGNPNGQTNATNFIAVAPSNSNVMYVVKGGNLVYKTTTGGGTWTYIGGNGLPSLPIADIAVDPFDANRVWVGYSGYTAASKIYRSDNAGANWTNITSNLPNLPVNCISVQPNSNNILYVGMDVGIYSKDATQSNWTDCTGDLPNVIVNEIEINTGLNKLQVGTFGRGAWQADLPLPNYCEPTFVNPCTSGHF